MPLGDPIRSVQAAIERLDVLHYLDLGYSNEGMLRIARQYSPGITRGETATGDREVPAHCYFVDGTKIYVFVCGVRSGTQANDLVNAYKGSRTGHSVDPSNPWFDSRARRISEFALNERAGIDEVIVTGHSAGGAIGVYMQRYRNHYFPRALGLPRIYVVSFGSPKPGGPNVCSYSTENTVARFMNTDDPVPHIPPSLSTGTRIWEGISIWQAQRMESYIQPAGGIEIGLTGSLTPRALPLLIGQTPVEGIGSWLNAQTNGRQNAHSINVYSARLYLARPPAPTAPPLLPPVSPAQVAVVTPRVEIERVLQEQVRTIFHDATRRSQTAVVIPKPLAWVAARNGSVWEVKFGGLVVAYGPGKKRARALAVAGNNFLKRLQRQGSVITGDLEWQMASYLASASNADSGIRPPFPALP